MPTAPHFSIRQLSRGDAALARHLLTVFGEAFEDADTYAAARSNDAHFEHFLGDAHVIALTAQRDVAVVGGLVAYVLPKLERERCEIYLYDLAVAAAHRRHGIATALIKRLQEIAAARGAYVIFVQADPSDAPAIALYTKLGLRENVLHFDIPVT